MRRQMRALVFLFWLYSLVSRAVGAFAQIYIYELFDSVQLNIIAAMLSFTGIMIGFCIYGAAAAQFRLNAKSGFLLSFLFTGLGLILLPAGHNLPLAFAAMGIRGLGMGFFWLAIHTYELIETRDHERDIYSTFLSAGDQILTFAGPAFATLLIWVSHILGLGEYTLLFAITPLLFLPGFRLFGALSDYRPEPIQKHDLKHFVADRRNRTVQVYLMGGAATHILQQALIPLAAIKVLGTALNVGGFNTAFAIAGAAALLAAGNYRHPKNRLLILGLSSIVLVLLNVMLGASMTLAALIVYTAGTSVMQPMLRVSQHVIDLQTMDSVGHHKSDFYPTMIFRDVSLWIWRMMAALALLAAASFAGTGREAISLGMYFIAGGIIVTYAGAKLLFSSPPKIDQCSVIPVKAEIE